MDDLFFKEMKNVISQKKLSIDYWMEDSLYQFMNLSNLCSNPITTQNEAKKTSAGWRMLIMKPDLTLFCHH